MPVQVWLNNPCASAMQCPHHVLTHVIYCCGRSTAKQVLWLPCIYSMQPNNFGWVVSPFPFHQNVTLNYFLNEVILERGFSITRKWEKELVKNFNFLIFGFQCMCRHKYRMLIKDFYFISNLYPDLAKIYERWIIIFFTSSYYGWLPLKIH